MSKIVKSGSNNLIRQAQDKLTEIAGETHQLEVVQQSPIWLRASIITMMGHCRLWHRLDSDRQNRRDCCSTWKA